MALIQTSDGGFSAGRRNDQFRRCIRPPFGVKGRVLIKLSSDLTTEWIRVTVGQASTLSKMSWKSKTALWSQVRVKAQLGSGGQRGWAETLGVQGDGSGEVMWSTFFGSNYTGGKINTVHATETGGLCSQERPRSRSGQGARFGFVATMSSDGVLLELDDYGTPVDDYLEDLVVLEDGSMVGVGYTKAASRWEALVAAIFGSWGSMPTSPLAGSRSTVEVALTADTTFCKTLTATCWWVPAARRMETF